MRKIIVRTYLLFNIKQFITRRPHIPQDPSLHYPKKGFYHQGPGHKGCHEVTALETFTLSTISLQHSSKAFYQGILFKQKSVQFNRGRGGDKWRTVLGGDVVQNKPRIWNNVNIIGSCNNNCEAQAKIGKGWPTMRQIPPKFFFCHPPKIIDNANMRSQKKIGPKK